MAEVLPGQYVGRFAPSPTGELHIGSLLTAVASYLDARSLGGKWILRIEDLDPPREVPGASLRIIRTLERYGFCWDGDVVWQHQRHDTYADGLDFLRKNGFAYPCGCSRKRVREAGLQGVDGWRYPGFCRNLAVAAEGQLAWRLKVDDQAVAYVDRLQGVQSQNLAEELGDFVLLRADGCWAYQLAVVLDDAAAGISHVVRGSDLLDSTPRQIYLQRILGLPTPQYMHLPVLVNAAGEKLSKQTLAPALQEGLESEMLGFVLKCLGQELPPFFPEMSLAELWEWAITNWTVSKIPQCKAISVEYAPKSGYKIL